MSRLTKVYGNGNVTLDAGLYGIDQTALDIATRNSKPITAAVAKLKEYEDAEENGLLIRLPCKVGDTVYELDRWCDGSHGDCDKRPCNECPDYNLEIYTHKFAYDMLPKIGKTVFLTREEAEQALKARDSK